MCMQVADSVSAVFGGAAFDLLHLNARQVSSIMLGVTLAPTMIWTWIALLFAYSPWPSLGCRSSGAARHRCLR